MGIAVGVVLAAGIFANVGLFGNNAMALALIGPLEYENFDLSLSGTTFDSPFNGLSLNGYFHLEDFEDTLFNEPGVTVSGNNVCVTGTAVGSCAGFGPESTDSVDGDDGVIDQSGNGALQHTHFATNPGQLTYTFDNTGDILCALPTHVGIVWTDGLGTVTFEAFDFDGNSIAFDNTHVAADDGFTGQTEEDRFYGAIDLDGISEITISNSAGIEVDHLQYGIESCGAAVFLVIDEESIDNGNPPNFFSDVQVNDHIADIGLRTQLPFFAANVGETIRLHTGQVDDEGWFALKTIPDSWKGLSNFVSAGEPEFGDSEDLLDKIPDVTPLRATGLSGLEGKTVCAVVYDSDISINYDPLDGSLKGANLGIVAFEVDTVTQLTDFSDSSLPEVEITILDADEVCGEELELFADAPEPISSSEPFDVEP